MFRGNKFFILVISLMFAVQISSQQLSKEELDTCRIYTSLEDAKQNPLEVFILDLSKSKLTSFPMEILEMKNLHILKLSKNKIVTVPDSISGLINLVELDLEKNLLSEFPMGITKLINLKKLVLSQNTIVSIPFDIKNLQKLEYLDMWSNELSYFPDSMKEMTALKVVDLRVIQFSRTERAYILSLFPTAKVLLSESCNCGPN